MEGGRLGPRRGRGVVNVGRGGNYRGRGEMNWGGNMVNGGRGMVNWGRGIMNGGGGMVNGGRGVHRHNMVGERLGLRRHQYKLMLWHRLWGCGLRLLQMRLDNREQRRVFARQREREKSANC